MTKKDFYLAATVGFLFGLLLVFPAKNLDFAVTPTLIFAAALGFGIFAPLLLYLLFLASRFSPIIYQFGKFAAVGALNTLLDLGILNFLILLFDVATGLYFSLFKAISFLVAVTNSYFWNKLWTFQSPVPANVKEYIRFAFATFLGLLINVGVASVVVKLGASSNFELWANIGGLTATFASLFWNFIAYRYIVFK